MDLYPKQLSLAIFKLSSTKTFYQNRLRVYTILMKKLSTKFRLSFLNILYSRLSFELEECILF